MILLSQCYETWSYEDLEMGDAGDRGYVFEDVPHTFRELVSMIKHEFNQPSDYPATANSWLSTSIDTDYRTGEETIYSLHFSHNNKAKDRKYWEKALRYCGIIKG